MIIQDALNVLSIDGVYNPEVVKQAYRKACSKYHPDRNPAGSDMMKLVNEAYETLQDKSGEAMAGREGSEYGDELFQALQALVGLGLEIEVCGSWVWLHGDTKPHKETLKQAGFRWASHKKLWYYRPQGYKSRGRGRYSMQQIREKHGSERVHLRERERLQARG